MGVRSRFVLVLVNLLRNAYQVGSAQVGMTVDMAAGRLQITIDDNGPGVPPEHREQIFADGYSTRPGGSGHGLALARETIEHDMDGTLMYADESALGGARFVITLPPHSGRAI